MATREPDFWIADYEIRIDDPPRACRIVSRAPMEFRDDAFLCEIEPPYPTPQGVLLNRAVLVPRWEGTTLVPLSVGLKAVNVLQPLRPVSVDGPPLTRDECAILDWATVHESFDEAMEATYPPEYSA